MRCYIFLFNPSKNFKITNTLKQRTNDYLSKLFPILELFNENYKPTDEPVEPIKLKHICDTIQNSYGHLNLDKKNKSYI